MWDLLKKKRERGQPLLCSNNFVNACLLSNPFIKNGLLKICIYCVCTCAQWCACKDQRQLSRVCFKTKRKRLVICVWRNASVGKSTLLKDLCLSPNTNMAAHNSCNSSSRASNILFWLLLAPNTHMVHRDTCRQNTLIHEMSDLKHTLFNWKKLIHASLPVLFLLCYFMLASSEGFNLLSCLCFPFYSTVLGLQAQAIISSFLCEFLEWKSGHLVWQVLCFLCF